MNGTASPLVLGSSGRPAPLHGLPLLWPSARMCTEMVCSWEGSQRAWDSFLARLGCLQARGAGRLC